MLLSQLVNFAAEPWGSVPQTPKLEDGGVPQTPSRRVKLLRAEETCSLLPFPSSEGGGG